MNHLDKKQKSWQFGKLNLWSFRLLIFYLVICSYYIWAVEESRGKWDHSVVEIQAAVNAWAVFFYCLPAGFKFHVFVPTFPSHKTAALLVMWFPQRDWAAALPHWLVLLCPGTVTSFCNTDMNLFLHGFFPYTWDYCPYCSPCFLCFFLFHN